MTPLPNCQFLDGVDRANLGSTCYGCNGYFNALLRHLGYEVRLCGAAMNLPDVHAVSVVELDLLRYSPF